MKSNLKMAKRDNRVTGINRHMKGFTLNKCCFLHFEKKVNLLVSKKNYRKRAKLIVSHTSM
jgi:hypothetical protein